MSRFVAALVLGGFTAVVVMMAFALGMVSISGPSFPEFSTIDVRLSLPTEAKIAKVEPISLDCRARVFAEVPLEGRREHEAFGVVYRTDRISMHAYGDVDTCVDGSSVDVTHHRDGTTDVVIPGESIVFVRPRVDAVRSASSVRIDKDPIGKLIDAFPWVDDNMGLTPMAYAYAQNVIGSSACMRTAYVVTEDILVDAYRQQAIDQGVEADQLSVRIDGEPIFRDPLPIDMGEVEMKVTSDDITCTASDGVRASGL